MTVPLIGLLHNPGSHRNKLSPIDPALLGDMLIEMPRGRAAIEPALRRFAAQKIDILVIDGGDGTVRDVLTRGAPVFGAHWPRLIVLPKGKTNALAVDLGVPRKWSLAQALAAVRDGSVISRRPLVIEREGAAEAPLWGFIFGAAAFNAAIETGQLAHRTGAFQSFAIALTAALGFAQALFGIGTSPWRAVAPLRVLREPGGEELPRSAHGDPGTRYLALFSSLRRFPIGIRPFPWSDRSICYLLIDAPLRRVVARLPAILRGVETPTYAGLGIHRGAGEDFVLDLAERGFILDGEAFAPGRLRLRQGPALQFITP